jgi:ubiquinone/menaquinone biosynthesis C-methylase UbiE
MAINQMKINPNKLKNEIVETVKYPDNYFDFISLGAVLEHLYNPSDILESTLRWLKPGGIIHIEVPSSDWLISKLINLYYKLTCRDYVSNLSPMHMPYHLYEFSLNSFGMNSRNKYKIVFYEYYVCKTFLPPFMDFIIKPIMKKTNTGMQLCVCLKKI